jgi:hypothetical protein
MSRKKKTQEEQVIDLEDALEELKREFEALRLPDVECDCGWSGMIDETLDADGQMVCPGCNCEVTFIEEMEMATAKTVSKLGDKLVKVGESFTINMIEVSGRNKKTDWVTAKIMVSSVDDLVTLVREAADMERDS